MTLQQSQSYSAKYRVWKQSDSLGMTLEFLWFLSLVLITSPKSIKTTCQLVCSKKHLVVNVQWDTTFSVQNLFWSANSLMQLCAYVTTMRYRCLAF